MSTPSMTDGQSILSKRISSRLIGVKPVQKDREMIQHLNKRHLWERKLDVLYFIFFAIHLPVMLAVDLVPLYHQSLTPTFVSDLRDYYIATYSDRFFSPQAPAWFRVYIWMEALYHIPLSIWALKGLWQDSPYVPLQLLLFSTQVSVTTTTCIAEMLSWPLSPEEKGALAWLYVPYLFLAVIMGLDMFLRLNNCMNVILKSDKLEFDKLE